MTTSSPAAGPLPATPAGRQPGDRYRVLVARTPEEVPPELPPGLVVVLPGGIRMYSGATPPPDRAEPPRAEVRPPEITVPDADRTRARAAELVRLVREVLTGRRPAGQLAGLTAPPVLRYIRAARPAPHRGRPGGWARAPGCGAAPGAQRRAHPVHVDQPHPDAAEICTTLPLAGRNRALILRIDRAGGDDPWVVTAARLL
ncbi:hypothetical protein GCM10009613_61970 [Pseudonocardia kongjuensis]|uniref:Uncharacterized protein n=1 Tax=Pseudonocardia kongjuensis TaxID=102227 RepID=A0ABP4J2L5_9PSEU